MEEEIAKFFGQSLEVIVFDCLEYLIDFLDQHGFQRIEILLLVPGTAVRAAQGRHDIDKFFELWPGLHAHKVIIEGVLHSYPDESRYVTGGC
jgi:hypothetical protein